MPLTILYRDEHYIAIDKPPGLLVHRSPISQDQVFALQMLRDQLGQRVYPVHRLDRATSGVLLFGLSPDAARALVRHFETRQVDKRYLAVARGWLDDDGTIDHPVSDEDGTNVPQNARTHFTCLARAELPFAVDRYPSSRYSLLRVTPETGRRQQIRKRLKHVSHHLIGDTTHGNGKHNRFFREHFDIHRMLLLAASLGFTHPFTGHDIHIQADLDDDWLQVGEIFDFALSDHLADR